MGDYKFSVNSSVVTSVDFPVSTSNSLFFTTPTSVPDSLANFQHPSIMQDDLIIEKSSRVIKTQNDVNEDLSKSKDDCISLVNIGNGTSDKPNDQNQVGTVVSAPLQLPSGFAVSEPVINSTNSTSGTLWSAAPIEDTLMHSLNVPGVNGTLTFQNFPQTNPNTLYNSSLGPQISGLSQSQQQQRRAITATHNFPHNLSRHMQQQNHPQNLFMANKSYSTWSNPQQNTTWSTMTQSPANITSLSSWNRGRSVPNLNPLQQLANRKPSPTFSQHSGMVISPKFRRSTSYPGKNFLPQNPGFDVTTIDENRDLLAYQDRNTGNGGGPLENMRNLELYLNDIMRGNDNPDQQLKGFVNCNQNALQSIAQMHAGKCLFPTLEDQSILDDGQNLNNPPPTLSSPSRSSPHSQSSEPGERFSRKVFVGGLPPDIDEDEITSSFRRFGPLVVDWPHKAESKSYFPPKGYAFLLFQEEISVQQLMETCIQDEDKLYLCVSSPTIKDKPVQIRPWRLSDADFVLDASMPLDPRKTVFVGGVPRPLKAVELAMIMDRLYGGVCYAGIDTDPELKYPKGAGRVAFSNQQSYIAAISARFVQLQHADIDKRVEVKPYVLDDQMCDECQGQRCAGKFAPFFCANVTCLQYYCEHCWATIHSRPGREFHKPLVKEGADRPRAVPFRWC
ncbi:cytoplasmic polyadenylation element-binding protein 2 isoform X2 [Bemisia tabaci]|uniref:cytoplasmic polyadenylation element-binding protein 2 isoform X2 n=1 Tax=Bemisia tabaci TaxID=7038 RepID=UPI0008F9A3E5|nr:PREDICTED: cytoplasmic polyadenylation element-binding protein 2 isoform X2 [Bemisia tabaci]